MEHRKASEEEQEDGIAELNDNGAEIVSVIAKYSDGTEIEFDRKVIIWRPLDA